MKRVNDDEDDMFADYVPPPKKVTIAEEPAIISKGSDITIEPDLRNESEWDNAEGY